MGHIESVGDRQAPARSHGPRRGWALALTSVAFFMVALDALVVITALPAIGRDLGGGMATLEWTVNAYTLTFAAGIITAAALGDRLGRRRVFAAGLALFTAASAACALVPSADLLVAARAIQGIGAAIVMPLSLTILTTAFPAQRRGAIVGIWGGIAGIAVASGPVIGGAVTQGLDWHWIFWVNVPIGLVATVLSVRRLAESRGPATRLDLPAVGLVSGGVTGIIWSLVRANEVGWGSLEIIAALSLGILALVGFVVWERGADAAAAAVPQPQLHRRQHHRLLDDGGPARGRLPRLPVLAGRPRRLAAGHGTALPALDGDAAAGRAGRRRTLRPDRAAAGDGRRHAPARRGPGLVRAGRHDQRRLRATGRSAAGRRRRYLNGAADHRDRRTQRGRTGRHGQGSRRQRHPAALRGRLRHRGQHGGLRRQRAAGNPAELHRRVSSRAGPRRRPLAARRGQRAGRQPQTASASRRATPATGSSGPQQLSHPQGPGHQSCPWPGRAGAAQRILPALAVPGMPAAGVLPGRHPAPGQPRRGSGRRRTARLPATDSFERLAVAQTAGVAAVGGWSHAATLPGQP